MQAFLFLTALAAASAVDCRKRTIPDFLCLLTAAAGLISFSPAQFFGVLAALPLLIAALIRPECMGGGDIKLTAAAGFVLGFWRGIWGMALGLLLAVLYFCTAMLFQKFIHHPLEMDEIPAIQELLKDAKSFRCYGFDCYERYWELTDKEYLAQLETKREEITHEILERCRTKRKNLYITGPVALNVAQKFSVHRLCDKEGKHNLANRFVGELMEQLVQDGLLVTTKTRNGPGVRTATDAEISSPLPGQQQMTL